jgi:hypothetical protein
MTRYEYRRCEFNSKEWKALVREGFITVSSVNRHGQVILLREW